jgi:transposase
MAKKVEKKMATFQRNDKINRIFSESFKREKVALIMQKKLTIKQCSALYGVTTTTVYKWLTKYSSDYGKGTKMVVQLDSEASRTLALQGRVAELERAVGQKQLEVDYLNRLLLLLSGELGYDVKKKYEPPPLNGFASIPTSMNTA